MFWGLNLKPNRKYTQVTNKSFHISQAALDVESVSSDEPNRIFVSCDNQKFLVCTLRKGSCEQAMLDLNFAEGDEICFQSVGSGNVSLAGYLVMDDVMNLMDGEDDGEEEESENEINDEDLRNALNKKAKAKKAATKGKNLAGGDDEDDDDEEDDPDFNGTAQLEAEDDDEDDSDDEDDEDDEEEDDDDDEEEEDESEDEEVPQPKAKQAKLEKPQKQQNGVAKENAVSGKKDKKDKKANQQQQPQQSQQQKGERMLTGGVKIEDVRVGNGPEAKAGKRVQVYYEGRLKSNNKMFDSMKQGAGFKFGLGKGEVIKGWDVGVAGMKVGGKRRIICPPHMAYGARGSPPVIPPNSTLVFEVELKAVN